MIVHFPELANVNVIVHFLYVKKKKIRKVLEKFKGLDFFRL